VTNDKEEILEILPAPNRKPCANSNHYFSRFKDGYNLCREHSRQALSQRVVSDEEVRNTMCSLPIKTGWGYTFGEFLKVFLKESAIKGIAKALKENFIVIRRGM